MNRATDGAGGGMLENLGLSGLDEVQEVGRGAFGVIYRARQAELDRLVAIKLLSGDFDPEALRRFDRERKALGALSAHPHIVTIYASGLTDHGRPYLMMEFAPGGSLAERLQRDGPVPWPAADLGAKLGDALAATHRQGILHRDIKPENVLFSAFAEPMLADFGIARIAGSNLTRTGVVTATLAHAAPEVLEGKHASEASDVYSLASTIFAVVAGKAPFVRDTDESLVPVIARIATEPPENLRVRGVPDGLCNLLERGLAKDPASRGSALEFSQAARRLTTGSPRVQPTVILGPGIPAQPGSSTIDNPAGARSAGTMNWHRKPIVLGAFGAVAIGTVTLAVVLLSGSSNTHKPTPPTTIVSTSSQAAQDLPSGTYVSGPEGTAHYFISLTTSSTGDLKGTVSFLAQDGQTPTAFTFSGTTQATVATLTPSSGPPTIAALFGSQQITLGECTTYLQFATSNADCDFTFSPSGP